MLQIAQLNFPEVYTVGHACSNWQVLVTERQTSVAIKYFVMSMTNFGFPNNLILILLFRRISEFHSHIKEYIWLHPACMASKKVFCGWQFIGFCSGVLMVWG